MLNMVALMGRLVADPELRQTTNKIAVATFRIAVDRNISSKDGNRQVDFINIVAWRGTAEFVSKYFNKGDMVALQGSIQTRQYNDRDGNKRTVVEVLADQVWFGQRKENNAGKPASDEYDEIEMDDLPF